MSAYISFECVRHGFVDVDTSSVGCPECETESVKRQVTEGQIAVLEELLAGQDGHWIVRASAKIAALAAAKMVE